MILHFLVHHNSMYSIHDTTFPRACVWCVDEIIVVCSGRGLREMLHAGMSRAHELLLHIVPDTGSRPSRGSSS